MRWWEAKEGQAHAELIGFVDVLAKSTGCATRWRNRDLFRQVYDLPGTGLVYGHDECLDAIKLAMRDGLFYFNVVQVAVDSVLARLATAKPRVTFQTNGGTWTQRIRARRLQRYIRGALQACGYQRQAMLASRDAAIADIGLVQAVLQPADIKGERWKLAAERVDPDEIIVDNAGDGYYGKPLTMMRARTLGLQELIQQIERIPNLSKKEREQKFDAVKRAGWLPQVGPGVSRGAPLTGEVRGVVEGWYPSAAEGQGRYVMACDGVTLFDQPMGFFPFASITFFPPSRGYFGKGIASRVWLSHLAVAEVLERVSVIWQQMAKPTYWKPTGCEVPATHFTSPYIGAVLEGGTQPPQVFARDVLSPIHLQLVDWQIRRALESVGLNEIATSGQKPAGLDSGVALREATDLVTGRQAQLFDAVDGLAMDVSRALTRIGAWAAENGLELVGAGADGGKPPVEWKDCELDEAAYVLERMPSSSLPATPAARRQAIQEMYAQGIIDSATYRDMMEMPDLEAQASLELSARWRIDGLLERFLEDETKRGEPAESLYKAPDPFDDLGYAVKRGIQVLKEAETHEAPEERLRLVRRFVLDAQGLLTLAAQPVAVPPTPGQPPAAPVPPPSEASAPLPPGAPA